MTKHTQRASSNKKKKKKNGLSKPTSSTFPKTKNQIHMSTILKNTQKLLY